MYVQYMHTSKTSAKALRCFSKWDERKRQANLAKHHIDFQDVLRVFDGPVFERVDSRQGEERVVAIGSMEDIEIVVVYVTRG